MTPLHITTHALQRAIERLGYSTPAEADAALRTPAVIRAAEFAAMGVQAAVRLPSGHRIVVRDHCVVTVLPADNFKRQIGRRNVGVKFARKRRGDG